MARGFVRWRRACRLGLAAMATIALMSMGSASGASLQNTTAPQQWRSLTAVAAHPVLCARPGPRRGMVVVRPQAPPGWTLSNETLTSVPVMILRRQAGHPVDVTFTGCPEQACWELPIGQLTAEGFNERPDPASVPPGWVGLGVRRVEGGTVTAACASISTSSSIVAFIAAEGSLTAQDARDLQAPLGVVLGSLGEARTVNGAGTITFLLEYTRFADTARTDGVSAAYGVAMRGTSYAAADVPVAVAFEVAAGWAGGFAYDVGLGLGPGFWFHRRFAAGLTAGVGADGATGGSMPFGISLPVRLSAVFDALPGVRLAPYAEVRWIFFSDHNRRGGGSATAPFADEACAGADILLGRRTNAAHQPSTQFALRLAYREALKTQLWTVSFGLGAAEEPALR